MTIDSEKYIKTLSPTMQLIIKSLQEEAYVEGYQASPNGRMINIKARELANEKISEMANAIGRYRREIIERSESVLMEHGISTNLSMCANDILDELIHLENWAKMNKELAK